LLLAAEPVPDTSGNYLHLLNLPKEKLSAELQEVVASVKGSKVPSKEEAVRLVLRFSDDKPTYMRDARISVRAKALFRLGRAVPGFAAASDFVWAVHVEMIDGGLMQVFYVSAGTGKVLPAFPEVSNAVQPTRAPAGARGSP
jgi:hypothetical protein